MVACSVYDTSLLSERETTGGASGAAGTSGSAGSGPIAGSSAAGNAGEAGASGASAGTLAGGAAGSAGSGGASGPVEYVIDDMEDGDGQILTKAYEGQWYAFDDATSGCRAPGAVFEMTLLDGTDGVFGDCLVAGQGGAGGSGGAPNLVAPGAGGAPSSIFAVYIRTVGFTSWGSGLGLNLHDNVLGDDGYADASAYQGISFWARRSDDGASHLRLYITERRSIQGSGCNVCKDFITYFDVSSEWTKFRVPFSAFKQDLGADPYYPELDPTGIGTINMLVGGNSTLDLWLDDISFYAE